MSAEKEEGVNKQLKRGGSASDEVRVICTV